MKSPLVRTVVVALVILAAAVWALNTHNATVEDYEYQLGRAKLHTSFLERGAFIRSVAEEERYRDETAGLFKWYGAEVAALYNRFPTRKVEDAAMKDLEALVAAGKLKKEELEARREWFDLAKHFHGLVTGGRYAPLLTASASGVRVDVASLARVQRDGKPSLQLDLVVWGAPRRETTVRNEGYTSVRMSADFGIRALSVELIDENEKLVGGLDGGAPVMMVDHPERWIPDFPPQALLATYWLDPLKAEAARMDLDLQAEIRSPTAGALPVSIQWSLPVRGEWRVREGEKFEGDERVLPEEFLDRSTGTAAPTGAPAPAKATGKGK